MHAADPARSFRLYRALDYIKSCGHFGCTTAELQAHTGSMAPGTDVSEIRQNGYLIACDYEGKTKHGRRIYRYRFVGKKS
jgi:hypothetical protein